MKNFASQNNSPNATTGPTLNESNDFRLENTEYFDVIFKTLSEGVALNEIVFDKNNKIIDYKILAVNDAFYHIADYNKNMQVVGSLASELYGLDSEFIFQFWEEHKKVEKTIKVEYFSKLSNRYFIISTSPFINNRFVTSFFDITEIKLAEEKIVALNEFSKSLIYFMQDGFSFVDKQGIALDVNPALIRMTGFSKEELIGKGSPHPYWPPEEFNVIHAAFLKTLGGEEDSFELTFMRKNGERFPVIIRPYSVKNSKSETIGFAATVIDISDRKRSEENLKESETQYRLLFQNLNGIFALYDALLDDQNKVYDLRFVAVNETFEKSIGVKSADVIGKCIREVFPLTEPRWIELFGKVAMTGKSVLYEDYTEQLSRHFEGYAFSPKKGQVAHIGRDITDRKKAEKELKDSQELLKYGLEGSGDGIWDWNIIENKIFFSKSWHQIFGFEDQEIRTTDAWFKLVCQEDVPKIMDAVKLHFETRIPFHQEHRFSSKDGSLKWVLIRGMVVSRNSEDQPMRMIGTTTDISRIKYAEKQFIQASKLASLGEMSAGIAHEINNPLAIILGMTKSLAKTIDNPEKISEKIEIIQKAGMRISKIISGLKKFSRTSEEKVYANCLLSNIVDECLVLTSSNYKNNETQIIFGQKSNASILCDEVEIEQVLINLINNAIDAVKNLDEKWVIIDLINKGTDVLLRVTDSGKGIPLENQPRLFDPFFTTKSVGEGTGLGLSIIKGILDEHQATIKIDTNCPNTCFEIRFKKVEEQPSA